MLQQLLIAMEESPIQITLSADTNNYNMFTAAGSPTKARVVRVTINSGVTIGSTSTGTYSFDTGTGWPAGSRLFLINNGEIQGKGGLGGAGGAALSNGDAPKSFCLGTSTVSAAAAGSVGGPALRAQFAIRVENNGAIRGGGGGGAGGCSALHRVNFSNDVDVVAGGGGGGCGRGTTASGGVAGGVGSGPANCMVSFGAAVSGNASGASSSAAASVGGSGGFTSRFGVNAQGGSGGAGGAGGAAGGGSGAIVQGNFQGATAAGGSGGACTNGIGSITFTVNGTREGTLG